MPRPTASSTFTSEFSLKYMHELPERPVGFEEDILKMLYNAAEFANMPVERQTEYEIVMRNELDIIAEKNYAREEGRSEGRAEVYKEVAAKLLAKGLSIAEIAEITSLSKEEIEGLR